MGLGLDEAVGAVVAAVGIDPTSFALDPDFGARARRRQRPTAFMLGTSGAILVFVPGTAADEPAAAARPSARRALESLTAATLADRRHLVVAWDAPSGCCAAVFALASDGDVGPLLAASWRPPQSWDRPSIDRRRPLKETLGQAMAQVEMLARRSERGPGFDDALDRSVALVDECLAAGGGEGQHGSGRPWTGDTDGAWHAWFENYRLSVLNEWQRLEGPATAAPVDPSPPPADGPLSGISVFLSYARPDSATLARPVYEVLHGLGADVWFDQAEPVEQGWLDVGLADRIAACDAYVMCASDEFFERAGYATQELAWALGRVDGGDKLRHLVAVARPGTLLPTAAADWPMLRFHGTSAAVLGKFLVECLRAPPPTRRRPVATPATRSVTAAASLAAVADLARTRRRVRHLARYTSIDHEAFHAVLRREHGTRTIDDTRRCLIDVGNGLDWSGRLADIDTSLDGDPVTRDFRWRLGCLRAVAGAYWPLTEPLEESDPAADDITDDLVRMAFEPVPIAGWPAGADWGDDDRRFALRNHLGMLRTLQSIVDTGDCGWWLDGPFVDWRRLADAVRERRRECCDALMTMRLDGMLQWTAATLTWDMLHRRWLDALDTLRAPGIPWPVRLTIASGREDIAAVAAAVSLHAVRAGRDARQAIDLHRSTGPVVVSVGVRAAGGVDGDEPSRPGMALSLALPGGLGGTLSLAWADTEGATGRTTVDAPPALVQRIVSSI